MPPEPFRMLLKANCGRHLMTIKSEETQVADDWGFDRGTYTYLITPKKEGESGFVDGKYLTIYKRQADGSWKISHDRVQSRR
jgi:ketosteroid isomerase-like protein